MMTPTATVFVIDDDEAVRKSLGRLLGAAHYRIELFKSASEFLSRSAHPDFHKQVGTELGMAEQTVKTHRAHVMQKPGITSVPELIGVVKKAEVPPLRPTTKVS